MIVGIVLSIFSIVFFTQWEILSEVELFAGGNAIKYFALLVGANFDFDIISFFLYGPISLIGFFSPQVLAWLFVGYVSGSIAKGLKRGAMCVLLVDVVVTLIWIIFSIIAGEDLMAMFQGTQLIDTVGGMLTALIFGVFGGLLGGVASGKYEEWTG